MHIKNITIDGFKSYAQRTEVKNFDPFFNAITGLNGSGKSNILDSICFLLGITNLSQVRASSLQDLVYKNGQVGITKATVSITFDNKDQSKSPIGYESYKEITITRQIVIGGKNKYLINGVNAQNSRVADLFRTVGLNVNNPHFLIMQGRVTKVMNMKPPEILSMIEEATGTSMYEQKKISAQKMIHKKETKLQAINNTLDEELQPTLKKLREERAVFMKYQKLQRELERTQKFLLAYKFHIATCHVEGGEEKLMQLTNQKNELAKKAGQLHDQKEQLVNLIESQEGICSEEAEKALRELSEQLLEVQKTEAKVQSKLKNQQEQLKSDRKDLKFVEKTARDCENELAKKNKALEDKLLTCQKSQEEFKSQELAHTNAQKKFQAISAGLAIADDGEEASWKQQLLNTNNKISDLNTAIKQTRMKLNHTRAQLKSKQAELKKLGRSSTNETRLLKEAEGNLQKVQKQMQAIHYRENEYEELCNTKHNLDGQLNQLYNERSNLHSKMKLEFDFRNPDRNFDRSRVKGLVAELFTVTHNENTTALEVTGGGRLFNVVVDTSSTSQLLIDRKCTKGRTTYIPIDKMPGHRLSQNIIDKAKRLVGAANVDLALDLIDYDPALENAMRFVFGSTLVCTDIEIAAKLAYHPEIKCKTVSLDGQVVNPSGSLSGGSKPTSYLWAFTKNREIKRQILDIEHQLKALEKSLIQANEGRDRYFKLKPKLSQYEVEIENLKARLVNTSQAKLEQQCNDLSNDKDQQSELLLQSEKELGEATEKSEELRRKIEDAPAEREKELKKAEQEVERSRKMVEKMRKKFDDNEEILNTLKLEIQELESEVAGSSEKVDKAKQVIVDCEKKIEELTSILKEENSKVEACSKTMEDHRNKLREARREIGRLSQQLKQLEKETDKLKEHNQDIEEKIGKAGDDKRNAIKTVQDLLRDCEWMESEKENFGVSGTIYDFKENDPKEANKKYSKLKVDVEKLEKTVNVKAMQLLDKCEVKCNELLEKKRIVESDKSRIEKTIFELDQMKNEAVTQAYAQVNKNFGSIFSTLLPGATAKLSPMEGCSVLAGLEFRVGFGDVWKSNLNELSGGQRSLVALSLILALLLLKPAPIYILDEVDAALDLSHTQNIGRMLKDHFRHSQFVVVSLKDGMFDNANVLFRTKFVDGVSTVSRVSK